MQFIDRLRNAVDKQVENADARNMILKQLAVENANKDCQKIIRPVKNPTLLHMIEACSRVGKYTCNNTTMAQAFAAMKQGAQNCCSCGQPGHVCRDCPKNKNNKKGPGICPNCHKGSHFQPVQI